MESEELTGTRTGTESPPPPSTLSSADVLTPVLSPVPEPPVTDAAVRPTEGDLSTSASAESVQQLTPPEKRVIEFFRTGEGAFVATNLSVRTTVTGGTSILHSIEEVLKRHRIEMGKSDTSNISVREALRNRGDEAKRVIVQELKQMLDKKVWVPVLGSKLTASQRSAIIRSSMFIKRKNNPDGSFQKLKARLVAGGDQQNKELYDDLSSPTVSTSAVFTMLAVAAHEKRHVAVVDISGAFLNADMTLGVPVHMRLDRTMSAFVMEIDDKYRKYVDSGGGLIVHLKKALYGCVESSGLWYENLRATMVTLGYASNAYDKCVFNRVGSDGHQCTAAVHVDDLLIMSKSKESMSHLIEGLRKRYGIITLAHGPAINYLGMSIDMHVHGQAMITMKGYSDEIVKTSGVQGTAKSPATDGLFETREDAALVAEPTRVWFHKVVAMIL